jgi:hypothetical protein
VSFIIRICIGLIALVATSTRASDQNVQVAYDFPIEYLELPKEKPVTLWERFEYSFELSGEKIFTDRFHPLNTTQWYLLSDLSAENFREHTARVARNSFSRTIAVSARDAVFDLPFLIWLDDKRGFLVDLLFNSVTTYEELSVAPLDPAYRALERSWWKQLASSKHFAYGLRPFRTSPYAFVSRSFWSGETLLMMAHLRYHYSDFANHQFELALSLPLSDGYAIDLGTAYHFNRHDEAKRMVLKLSKQFDNGGIVHIGMEAQEHPRFLVGFSVPL